MKKKNNRKKLVAKNTCTECALTECIGSMCDHFELIDISYEAGRRDAINDIIDFIKNEVNTKGCISVQITSTIKKKFLKEA